MVYLGVEYTIRSRGPRRWQWSIYPASKRIGGPSGELTGARKLAVTAAQEAILAWLQENPEDGDP